MGLIVNIYRSDYDSESNVFFGKSAVTVVNISGPFEPTEDRPAALLVPGIRQGYRVIAAEVSEGTYVPLRKDAHAGPMNGGTIASTSDSRWNELTGGSPVNIHDRFETVEQYAHLSY